VTPYQVYCEYLALKSHFSNEKYDYFKYNKKVRASLTSFNRRTDKYWFEKTSRKFKDEEIIDFLVSNFVQSESNSAIWIGSLINEGEKVYSDWKRRQQSLTYLFKEQSEELLSETKLEDAFNCSKGHPPILKKFLGGKISPEVLVIYDIIFQFGNVFDTKLMDPVWETVSLKIRKYKPFIHIDKFQYKKLLREIINE
jgi:hypothetical protein